MMRSGIRRYGGFGTRFSGLSRVERMARSLGRSGEIETLSQALQAFVRA